MERDAGSDQTNEESRGKDSPVEFMRGRHPDLYSDSKIVKQPSLSKELLDYHLPQLLSCFQFFDIVASQLNLKDEEQAELGERRGIDESIFGLLFLTASLDQLQEMEPLPDVLENLGLLMPKVALLYALGHRDELRNEGLPAERYTDEEIDALIKLWFEQPGRLQIPARPLLMSGKLIELRSNVLGCKLICTVESADQSVFLAEAMLGATEAFLATSMRVQASAQSRESPTCAPVS